VPSCNLQLKPLVPNSRPLEISRVVVASRYRTAILGIFLIALDALRLCGIPVPERTMAALGVWTATALLALAAVPRLTRARQADGVQTALYAADVIFLTIVQGSLGAWWLGTGFYLLLIGMAIASLPRARAQIITGLAIAAFTGVTLAQYASAGPRASFLGLPTLARRADLTAVVLSLGIPALMALALMQRQFVRAMARAREVYRLLLQTAEDMIFTFDAAGCFHTINDAAVRQSGYTREELRGRSFVPYLVDEDVPYALEQFAAALDGEPRQYEVRYVRKDGTVRWIWCTNTPIRDAGMIRGVLAIVRDVTERKRAAAEQERALSLLRATLDSTADGILVVDLDRRIVSYNRQFAAMWRLPVAVLETADEETVLATVLDQVEDPDGFLERVRKIHHDADAEGWDVIRLRDGRIVVRYSRPQQVGGRTVGRVWSFRDVTQRESAMAALRESEQRYRMLLEQSTDGVVLVDADGRIVTANPAFCQMVGAPEGELIAKPLTDAVVPAPSSPAPLPYEVLRTGETVRQICQLRRRDGAPLSAEIASKMMPTGEFLALVRDVTERELLEAQLRQSQKLEALGQLAGGVAHDFNNLLTGISANAELALAALSPEDPAYADVEEIRRVTQRAASLTRQLLAFSRKQPVRPIVVDVSQAITDVSTLLQRLIGEDVELVLALSPGLWAVRADPGQLTQVLVNLAVNARDAMPDGGVLVLGAENESVVWPTPHEHGMIPAGEYVRLEVTDTGVGMTPEVQAHIFEPFFTTKEPGRGTGLGLSTVYGIVKQHGGHITVQSTPGRGTRVRILLPRERAANPVREESPAPAVAPRSPNPTTILLVEDDEAVLGSVQRMLEQGGYKVLPACRPQDALVLARSHDGRIDLLLTDMIMPGMKGRALAAEVEHERPGIRVLFMSGYTGEVVTGSDSLPPSRHLLPKPFTRDLLLRTVRDVLERGAPGAVSDGNV
jgi:two-component system cell cycle sensor histidine kinase/response regulator CckA